MWKKMLPGSQMTQRHFQPLKKIVSLYSASLPRDKAKPIWGEEAGALPLEVWQDAGQEEYLTIFIYKWREQHYPQKYLILYFFLKQINSNNKTLSL